MCIVCDGQSNIFHKNKSLIRNTMCYDKHNLDCHGCKSVTNDALKLYVLEHKITNLNCSNTNITKIPDIEGCYIITNNCYWLDKLHIEKVITTQKMIRNYYMRKKLIHIRDQLIPIYFHPEMKGGYLHKKSMMADF